MKLLTVLFITSFCSTLSFSQSINLSDFSSLCIGSPDIKVVGSSSEIEISGITICGSNANYIIAIQENSAIRYFNTWEYKNEAPVIGGLGLGISQDYESISYLFEEAGSHYYAACNEDEHKIAIFSINDVDGELTVNININNNQPVYLDITESNQIIPITDKGLEGLTYNPLNGKLYVSEEGGGSRPNALYESQNSFFTINDFINETEISVSKIPVNFSGVSNIDFSGLFHYNLSGATTDQNLIFLVSQESETVYLLDLSEQPVSLVGSLSLPGIHNGAKIEGVVFKNRTLLVCNDDDQGRPDVYSDFYSFVEKEEGEILGDTNCDGIRNILDAATNARIAVDIEDECDSIRADINMDGILNVLDAYNVARCAVNLKEYYCPCK